MDVNLINQFILAVDQIFVQVANLKLKKESLTRLSENSKPIEEIATILGITGALKGQIILVLKEELALKFASALLMGEPVLEYNDLAESGICEMVNMIAGNASRRLQELGHSCDISTPSVIKGESLEIGFNPKVPIFCVNFSSDWGPIQMVVALEMGNLP